jgi:hypothetical protein
MIIHDHLAIMMIFKIVIASNAGICVSVIPNLKEQNYNNMQF